MKIIMPDIRPKLTIVPRIPNNAIKWKFSKNFFFLRLYPPAKIIGGKINWKNFSSSNSGG
jgi:hypothetical protein